MLIELTKIIIKENVRKRFDITKQRELVQSIREKGIIEPIIVRPAGDKFEVVCGGRRFRAALTVGMKTIPAIVKELTDEQMAEMQIVENLQREDLNAVEEAQGFKEMIDRCKCTQEDLSLKVGKSQSYIAGRLALLVLPQKIKESIEDNIITPGHGAVLARIADLKEQNELFRRIISQKLSVRSAENELERFGRLLKAAPFDKVKCLKCAFNGNSQAGLFDKDTDLKGKCLNAICFAEKMREYINKRIGELKKQGFTVLTEEKFRRKCNDNYPPHVTLSEANWRGDPKKRLGKIYEEKCLKCEKRIYILSDRESYGDMKDIKKIEEWCLNERCFNSLIESKSARASGDLVDIDRDRLKRKSAVQALAAKRRFWKKKIAGCDSKCIQSAVSLLMILERLSQKYALAIEGVLPKEAIIRSEWGSNRTSAQKIYDLGFKKIEYLSGKAFEKCVEACLEDKDLEAICAAAGFTAAKDFIIDDDYLKAKTKGQIAKLAKEIGLFNHLIKAKVCGPKDDLEKNYSKPDLIALFFKRGFDLKGKIPKEIAGKDDKSKRRNQKAH